MTSLTDRYQDIFTLSRGSEWEGSERMSASVCVWGRRADTAGGVNLDLHRVFHVQDEIAGIFQSPRDVRDGKLGVRGPLALCDVDFGLDGDIMILPVEV